MRVLRTFLRPGWIALAVVVVAFAALCFSILAPWQLGKNSRTSERNHLIEQAVSIAPVPLASVSPPGTGFRSDTEWREVHITGTFLTDKQALVRLRSVNERPAVEVLTPFRVTGSDRVLVVDRGYVRPEQGQTPVVPAPPQGEVTIDGRIRAGEGTTPGRGAADVDGALSMYTIDPAELSRATSTAMDPFYIQISPNQPGALGEIPLPQLDSGPYLSYGLQWLAFGIMAPLGAGYFIYAEVKQRRRARGVANAAGTTSAEDTTATVDETSGAARSGTPVASSHAVAVVGSDRATRRKRLRAELRGDSVVDDAEHSDTSRIGFGPDTEHAPDDVRDKLTQRYGG
ncbi:SURF1 family cytochrome oxidase biogenesis protein [Gordonia aichiensis]